MAPCLELRLRPCANRKPEVWRAYRWCVTEVCDFTVTFLSCVSHLEGYQDSPSQGTFRDISSGGRGYFVSAVRRDEAVIRSSSSWSKKTSDWIKSTGANQPPERWLQNLGTALATSASRFERLAI